ncbi:class I SAM-dependent methyltransferase [Prochlorococcus marinus]|uniref:class I SAM-dependent methyltransferase n=1 Tax=Prochlorococcus marinus TaxID=1219 RepID=UPI0022B2ECBC|nr:methyltransferase domain-containing protein [Prochlorococcus marinus]
MNKLNSILTEYQRSKEDNNDDSLFYTQPRFVHHLDDGFRKRLTELYRKEIYQDAVVLDLMSSWVSHLPNEIKYKRVIGHGLNEVELSSNKRLDSYWVQNLNNSQKLPLETDSIDFCLIAAGWQYMQYPERIALELKRVLRTHGKLIISFSNRAFWIKSPRVWVEGSDIDRINYIKNVLLAQGWPEPEYISETNKKNGVLNLMGISGDPFLSVLASNN